MKVGGGLKDSVGSSEGEADVPATTEVAIVQVAISLPLKLFVTFGCPLRYWMRPGGRRPVSSVVAGGTSPTKDWMKGSKFPSEGGNNCGIHVATILQVTVAFTEGSFVDVGVSSDLSGVSTVSTPPKMLV